MGCNMIHTGLKILEVCYLFLISLSFFSSSWCITFFWSCIIWNHEVQLIRSTNWCVSDPRWNARRTVTLCDPMDCTVHGILQARILEWVAFLFSKESSQPRDQTQVSCIAGGFFTSWAIREAQRLYGWQKWVGLFHFSQLNKCLCSK